MAPEQITGQEVDARSDLFSFGALLHETLTGSRAFDGDDAPSFIRAAILERQPPPISSLQPLVPPFAMDEYRACPLSRQGSRREMAYGRRRPTRAQADIGTEHPDADGYARGVAVGGRDRAGSDHRTPAPGC